MAFNDTLFQLGMDLTRSSTAQKEEFHDAVRVAHEDRKGNTGRASAQRLSRRIAVDLIGSRCTETKAVEGALRQALNFTHANVEALSLSHCRQSGRLLGSAQISDGHVAIDICPAKGRTAIDVYSAGGVRPEAVLTALADAFDAREAVIKKKRSAAERSRLSAALASIKLVARKAPAGARALGAAKVRTARAA
jgi:S-adenosylmethionine decarboxylase